MSSDPPVGNDRLVLVVDDQEIKRYVTRRALEQAGITVCELGTGLDTLRLVPEMQPAVIVLDINLPDIDGHEVCRRLKANPETASILVLQFSADLTSNADKVVGLKAGADAYLALPVDNDVLAAMVGALLRQHGAELAARRLAQVWEATFDAIGDAICLIDSDGNCQQGNQSLERLFERPIASVVGTPFEELLRTILPVDLMATGGMSVSEAFELEPASDEPQTREVIAADGRHLRITIDSIRNAGRPDGAVCILTDISAEKLRESRLDAAYEREKHIAETLQHALLTPMETYAFAGLEIDAKYVPAWSEALVGGDFYDTFALDNGGVALVLADASGKGLTAAARTAEVKHALRAFLWEDPDPAAALMRLNNFICRAQNDDRRNTFFTAAVVTLFPATGTARLCVAAAEPPLIIRAVDNSTVSLTNGGLPLGVEYGTTYTSLPLTLAVGDIIVLATDGITEARHGRDFFGYEGMEAVARQSVASAPLRSLGNAILDAARQFAHGTLHDDTCLLLARRTGVPTEA